MKNTTDPMLLSHRLQHGTQDSHQTTAPNQKTKIMPLVKHFILLWDTAVQRQGAKGVQKERTGILLPQGDANTVRL